MNIIYNILFYMATPYIALRMLWRSRKEKAYRERLTERFGYYNIPKQQNSICLHAASLGETVAADTLIEKLLQSYPNNPIVVTNTTITGSRRTLQRFGDRVHHVYVPYDTPGAVKRFLKQFNPKLVILMERELWPNLLRFCKKYDITVLLANGRLPDRSAQRYAKVKNFTEKMLSAISCFAVTSENAIKNFLQLGVPTEKIELCGNVKFDAKINQDLVDKGISFRQAHCANRPVWIAASTHEGEEEIVLSAHAMIREHFPLALLVLVPRHPERFDSVFNLCKNQGYNVAHRSKNETPTDNNDIFLGDSMGEMFFYYSLADVSFVAGSIKPIGGHNLLEPASIGKPVITGKQLFNFKEGEALFKSADAMIQVENANDLSAAVLSLFEDENKLNALSQRGLDVVNSNKGAVEKHLSLIAELI